MTSPSRPPDPNGIRERLLGNKPLLALGIVLLLLFSVGQFCFVDDKPKHAPSARRTLHNDLDGKTAEQAAAEQSRQLKAAPASAQTNQTHIAPVNGLTPTLAAEFVKWWINWAMDYSAATAGRSHESAFQWMTPEAAQQFKSTFWTPQISQSIANQQMSAAFQPASVQAEAINPDGSVVVGVTGSLVVQASSTPITQQIVIDFLVRKIGQDCRIAGMYNRTTKQ